MLACSDSLSHLPKNKQKNVLKKHSAKGGELRVLNKSRQILFRAKVNLGSRVCVSTVA